jgi:hypothetical protein
MSTTSEERRMFALITARGTAMAETALCGQHRATHAQLVRDMAESDPAPGPGQGWDGGELHDCTGNEALSCIVCGYGAEIAS